MQAWRVSQAVSQVKRGSGKDQEKIKRRVVQRAGKGGVHDETCTTQIL